MNSDWKQKKINKKKFINENRHQHSGSGKTCKLDWKSWRENDNNNKKKLCLQPHVETLCLQLCWSFHTFRRERKQSGYERSQRKTCLGLLSLTRGVTGCHSLELLRIDKRCCPSPADENPGTSWRHVLPLLLISSKVVLHSSSEDEKYWESSRFHPSSWQGEGSNYGISIVSGDQRVLTSGGLTFFFLTHAAPACEGTWSVCAAQQQSSKQKNHQRQNIQPILGDKTPTAWSCQRTCTKSNFWL